MRGSCEGLRTDGFQQSQPVPVREALPLCRAISVFLPVAGSSEYCACCAPATSTRQRRRSSNAREKLRPPKRCDEKIWPIEQDGLFYHVEHGAELRSWMNHHKSTRYPMTRSCTHLTCSAWVPEHEAGALSSLRSSFGPNGLRAGWTVRDLFRRVLCPAGGDHSFVNKAVATVCIPIEAAGLGSSW